MKRPISFLLVSHSYPPVLGGSEMEAQRVCASLLEHGYRVEVLCAGGPPMPPERRWRDPAGVPVRMFGARSRGVWKDRMFALGVAWTLWRERSRYDLVYFLMQGLHLAAGLPVARLLGKPAVMKVSGSDLITLMSKSWIGRLELRWLQRWARRVLILNPGMVEEALSQGFERDQLLWMPNPVDVSDFAPLPRQERAELRSRLRIPLDAPVALYVGRLSPEKSVDALIESFAAVRRALSDARLVLVGDGPQRRELEALAKGLGPEAVTFVGRVPPAEVRGWMQAADLFALISPQEGFPCALAEAMSTGLASLVSDIPGNTQLVEHGIHGMLVPVGDRDRTASVMTAMLRNREDRERMGAAARQRVVEQYSTDRVRVRYEELFAEILSQPAEAA